MPRPRSRWWPPWRMRARCRRFAASSPWFATMPYKAIRAAISIRRLALLVAVAVVSFLAARVAADDHFPGRGGGRGTVLLRLAAAPRRQASGRPRRHVTHEDARPPWRAVRRLAVCRHRTGRRRVMRALAAVAGVQAALPERGRPGHRRQHAAGHHGLRGTGVRDALRAHRR